MNGALGDLELLRWIAETRSFVRAGERVGLSPSGVSRAVARLEARVGVRLFERNARAVTLTDEGRRFHERVQPLVSALEDAIDDASGARARVRGRLRINVDPFCARYFLGPRVHAFLAAYPELELDVVVRDHADDFIAAGFDAALRFGDPPQQGFVARRVLRTRVVTCASPAYVARMGRPRRPRDLEQHELILFRDPATGRPFEWELHRGRTRVKVNAKGRLLVNDFATALAACVAGHGIAQPMDIGIIEQLRDGTLIDLFPSHRDEYFPLNVIYPSKQHLPAKVRAFVDFVVQEIRTKSS
jgi:DNA-binding transcriptional LysR family regulator